jgi:RNA polymerase sigma-70 factor (ECF subfamily)
MQVPSSARSSAAPATMWATTLDDRDLVEQSRSNRSAFAELYRRHVEAVHAFAYRRSGSRDVAEEATSATFEKALRSIDSFEWRETGLRPWLYRIASNEVANVYRRSAAADAPRGQLALRALSPDVEGGTAHEIDTDVHGGALHRALNELPQRYRDAITLRHLSGLSADEAAIAMGCSKPALAVILHRAIGALRTKLANEASMTEVSMNVSGER